MLPVKKQNRMPSIFGDLFSDQWPDNFMKRVTTPQINVIETDKKFKIEVAAPGMSKDDLKIELMSDNQLIVSLERDDEKERQGVQGVWRRESSLLASRVYLHLVSSDIHAARFGGPRQDCGKDEAWRLMHQVAKARRRREGCGDETHRNRVGLSLPVAI